MQWIEVSIVCERVATDEVTTLFWTITQTMEL